MEKLSQVLKVSDMEWRNDIIRKLCLLQPVDTVVEAPSRFIRHIRIIVKIRLRFKKCPLRLVASPRVPARPPFLFVGQRLRGTAQGVSGGRVGGY